MRALGLLCFVAAAVAAGRSKQPQVKMQTRRVPLLGSSTHYFGTSATVQAYGYPVEQHKVVTPDGYKLNMYRIPNETGIPYFLMHGMLSSSADWCAPPPDRGLPYLLADAGYDVWMGNARGNTASREPGVYDPDRNAKFWDFSWHEIGAYDVPTMISYVLNHTRRPSLHYVGHSQGTTSFFVMASEVDGSMSKIRTSTLLGPAVFVRQVRVPLLRLLATYAQKIWQTAKERNDPRYLEIFPRRTAVSVASDLFCKARDITQRLCYELMFMFVGRDWEKQDRVKVVDFTANMPAGASLKQAVHYAQQVNVPGDHFRKFDYGRAENMKRYGTAEPPEYDITRANCNLTLVYGLNDILCTKSNVEKIHRKIPSSAVVQVASPNWNHLDFITRLDVKKMLHDGTIARALDYDRLHP